MVDSLIGNCGVTVNVDTGKVDRVGDTMTGDLEGSGSALINWATVNGAAITSSGSQDDSLRADGTYQPTGADAALLAHTGWLEGGTLSINSGDASTIDISAGSGWIVDHSDPLNPTRTNVAWTSKTAVPIPAIATSTSSGIGIDINGDVVVKPDLKWVNTDYADTIVLGFLGHQDNVSVTTATTAVGIPAYDGAQMPATFFREVIGAANASGNMYSPNADLTMSKTSGSTFDVGINAQNDPENPHLSTDIAQAVCPFLRALRSGTDVEETIGIPPTPVTAIDPNGIDLGNGVVDTVGNNRWTIQIVYWVPSPTPALGFSLVAYGQEEFNSLADAMTAFNNGTVDFEERIQLERVQQRAYLFVQQGATDLSDPAQAMFRRAPKFRMGGVGL